MNDSVLQSFGNKIRLLRKVANLSQEKVADLTGFHRTYIGMIERGERNVSLKNLKRFANAFNITLESLMKDVQ
ncbi:putative transcriptional regulator [Aequorivita sublithincola DSM 14238]|uniref:Putative transcriptional regulator n=1 Tax=Aequorivita sublithincola (strain DSM 14238 / LMG 21431 / ACAM 643 / 9-3) TaxID=746697 RepID=I3YTD0_AEQSU|nr:helix-turn-helix transcriptional regulator [Aequorivita sublithincola]AFL80248.1 putative transcriptional regulator [Aequorivita sublithincola DSM 14238]